jgi:hypothetical protein
VSRTHARDEGLRRVSTITRCVAAAGVAATAFLAAFVYRATPGRATVSTTQPGSAPAANAGNSDPAAVAPSDPSSPGFQSPAVAPTPAYQNPVVRSGAS